MKIGEIDSIPFQIEAHESGKVYITVTGFINGREFYWDSPPIKLSVENQSAEIKNLFVMSGPQIKLHKLIKAKATIQTYKPNEGYLLKFWQNSPTKYKLMGEIETGIIKENTERNYSIEFAPNEVGLHEIHVYLYEKNNLISREKDKVMVVED